MSVRSTFVRRRLLPALGASLALALAGAAIAVSVPLSPDPTDPGPPTNPVYGLAGNCYTLASETNPGFVARDGDGYRLADAAGAAKFRMQAAQLGDSCSSVTTPP